MFKNIKGLADSNIRNNDMIHVVLNLLTSSQTCIQLFSPRLRHGLLKYWLPSKTFCDWKSPSE